MNKLISVILIVLFVLGCKSEKLIVGDKEKIKSLSESKLIKEIEDKSLIFNNLYLKKFDCTTDFQGNSISFKGNLYLEKDSSIVVSIMPLLGIELFKLRITPNDFTLIDRTKKTVTFGTIDSFRVKYNVDLNFYDFQSIISNSFFGISCKDEDFKDCIKKMKLGFDGKNYFFKNLRQRKFERLEKSGHDNLIFFEYQIDPSLFRVNKILIQDFVELVTLKVSYSNFNNSNGFLYPGNMDIEGSKSNNKFRFTIITEQVEKDSNNGMGFKIPEKYTKVYLH